MEMTLAPGVRLHCIRDRRFKQGCLSLQFLRPLKRGETALGTLVPAVLLRGCEKYPDLESLTCAQDEIYGSYIGAISRKVRDSYACGFHLSFLEDRFALPGDAILEPLAALLQEIVCRPLLKNSCFLPEYVESEKQNLLDAIESRDNDKAAYAIRCLLKSMAGEDGLGIPRLGSPEEVAAVTPQALYRFYQQLLRESPVELFYIGSSDPEQVAQLLAPIFSHARCPLTMPGSVPFRPAAPQDFSEAQHIAQSHLCMGFVSPITIDHPLYPALLVGNHIFGGGMTSKLFMQVREARSLCYSISSSYTAAKGLVLVEAGIDRSQEGLTRQEILHQLAECQAGNISELELTAAKQSLLSSLRALLESPSAMESFFTACYIEGSVPDVQKRMDGIAAVTLPQVIEAVSSLQLHSVFFLKEAEA